MSAQQLVEDVLEAHRMARGWAYGGTKMKHRETHDYGIVCLCGWANMSDERYVCDFAMNAHIAEAILVVLDARAAHPAGSAR